MFWAISAVWVVACTTVVGVAFLRMLGHAFGRRHYAWAEAVLWPASMCGVRSLGAAMGMAWASYVAGGVGVIWVAWRVMERWVAEG